MNARKLALWGIAGVTILLLLFSEPDAQADPTPGLPIDPIGGSAGVGQPGLGGGGPGLSPAAATIFLCPGRGGAASVIGGGGGYCDFNFVRVQLSPTTYGVMHDHCEWGGFNPLVEMWNCWRVFPGQPDHPAVNDPDIIPDGYAVPWAIAGPAVGDQWPPPGLAPAPTPEPVPPPPPPETPPLAAPAPVTTPPPVPMFPPWDQPDTPAP